jgi:hypothetical protein
MKKYQLNKKDFVKEKELNYIFVDKLSLPSNKKSIELAIKYFNQQYRWDNMFTISDVEKRIETGHKLFLLFYGEDVIGYIFYKEIETLTCFAYNLYVTKIIQRPDYAAEWFYNRTSNHMLQLYDNIICEAEEWNSRTHEIFLKSGFKLI